MIKDLYSNLDYSKISDQSQNFQNVDRFFILIKSLKQYLKYHPNCSKYIQKETISQLAEIFNKNFITADFESVLKPDVKDLCYTFEIDENLEKSLHSSISSNNTTYKDLLNNSIVSIKNSLNGASNFTFGVNSLIRIVQNLFNFR